MLHLYCDPVGGRSQRLRLGGWEGQTPRGRGKRTAHSASGSRRSSTDSESRWGEEPEGGGAEECSSLEGEGPESAGAGGGGQQPCGDSAGPTSVWTLDSCSLLFSSLC